MENLLEAWKFGGLEAWFSCSSSPRRHKRNARAWALHRSARCASLPIPIPCVSVTFLGNRTQDCQNDWKPQITQILSRLRACYRTLDCQCVLEITVVCLSRLPRVLFSVFCSPFSGAQSAPSLHPRHVCDVPTNTQRADRACTQSTRSARRPKRAWRASHATLLGSWESSGVSRCPSCPIGPICPTAKFDDVSRRVKREADGREGAISGRLVRKATGVSPSDFAHTGVFAGPFSFPGQYAGVFHVEHPCTNLDFSSFALPHPTLKAPAPDPIGSRPGPL